MMNNNPGKGCRYATTLIIVFMAMMMIPNVAFSQVATTIRPIEDFVETQGTFCIGVEPNCFLIVPPIDNFIGASDPDTGRLASVDYAGLANEWIEGESGGAVSFGTETSGTVVERPLEDGRAEVLVLLKTRNALTWVTEGADFTNALLFGNRAPDVLNDSEEPALGNSFLQVKFINTAPGDPLPDLIQLIFFPEEGQEQLFFALRASAKGELKETFGVPDGTPGKATVTQTGLFMTPFMGAVEDGFPVERIKLQKIGK
jgi:hypothetical protein